MKTWDVIFLPHLRWVYIHLFLDCRFACHEPCLESKLFLCVFQELAVRACLIDCGELQCLDYPVRWKGNGKACLISEVNHCHPQLRFSASLWVGKEWSSWEELWRGMDKCVEGKKVYLQWEMLLKKPINRNASSRSYSAIKKNEIMPFAATWMNLEIIILSEVSQKEKDKYYVMSHICGI